ncbi:TetR/AcrR family transcriptional regulator [Kineosporia babensis]|uniref:TetR/AcrR family transcriptional regulator n=1 Tax=Kineosporia babensis TaxID=499548 RepID=A0A9X1SW98_9ACTN|nr:TetR/AcrR family transcriptional regulator [Kineosporia babensis]
MGLREIKAKRTRDTLHQTVVELAERDGYDAVTVEQIAEVAQISVATVYRYFPNKDAILLYPLAEGIRGLTDNLNARPEDEPIGLALGHALHELMEESWDADDLVLRLRAQLDLAPAPRARLLDIWYQGRALLEAAIARRAGLEKADLRVGLAAGVTLTVLQMALDVHRDQMPEAPTAQLADHLLDLLNASDALLPTRQEGSGKN